jgi:hypothetical protein
MINHRRRPVDAKPNSTNRRIATVRDGASCCTARQASIASRIGFCHRIPICSPLPVVFRRPRPFFGVPRIDFAEIFRAEGYAAAKAEAKRRNVIWYASAGATRKPKE